MKLKTILLSLFVTISLLLSSINVNAQTGRRHRAADGAPKDVHVSSYTKKNGTHVNSYNRRSPRS